MSETQFLRRASLVLSGTILGENGQPARRDIDLSDLHFTFKITQSDFITSPNTCRLTIYNLSQKTAMIARDEMDRIVLSAGYANGAPYGLIFEGDIKQARVGKKQGPGNVSPYLEILAADAEKILSSAVVNDTLQGNATKPAEQHRSLSKKAGLGEKGYLMDMPKGALSRGKVRFGLVTDMYRILDKTYEGRTSVQKGIAQMAPLEGYIPVLPGEAAVVLNHATGLIGVPEVTPEGVKVRCLLNPNVKIGSSIRINNGDINDLILDGRILYFDRAAIEGLPGLKPIVAPGDGLYKVLVAEYVGDTRGKDWYTEIIGLALTPQGRTEPNAGR